MLRRLLIGVFSLTVAACATPPAPPPVAEPPPADRAAQWLEPGEPVSLRVPAELIHGHDMQVPEYDEPMGYRSFPRYYGELLLTDRRLLFIEGPVRERPSWLSIPYETIAQARPSTTPLLNYLVVWNARGEPDSFVVAARHVRVLHQQMGRVLFKRNRDAHLDAHDKVKQTP